jgi:peptidoglycan/LPS O-acetylase OafA/YrhL
MLQGLKASALSWNYPAWSISVEFIAYLLFPFALPVVWRASSCWKIVITVTLFGLLALLAYLTRDDFNQWDGPITLLRCIPEFLLGTILYYAYRTGVGLNWLSKDSAAYLTLAAIIVCLHLNAPDLLIASLFPILILTSVLNRDTFSAWSNTSALIWLGNISYSLYLMHSFIQYTAVKLFLSFELETPSDLSVTYSMLFMLIMMTACLLAAHLSYSSIEMGCRRYLRRLFKSRQNRSKPTRLASATL